MRVPVLTAALAASALLLPSAAHAGACRDAWVNNAYRDLGYGQPNGNDVHGECNVKLYGNGSWSSYDDLKNKVRAYHSIYFANGQCRDPFIAQAYQKALGRLPNGHAENDECDMYNYGGGSWSSLDDLVAKVRAFKGVSAPGPVPPSGSVLAPSAGGSPSLVGLHLDVSGNVVNSANQIVAMSKQVSGIVAQGGGNLTSGAAIVAQGGGNMGITKSYSVQSVGGKTALGTITLRDGRKLTIYKNN